MHVHIYIYIYICIYLSLSLYIYIYIYIHTQYLDTRCANTLIQAHACINNALRTDKELRADCIYAGCCANTRACTHAQIHRPLRSVLIISICNISICGSQIPYPNT